MIGSISICTAFSAVCFRGATLSIRSICSSSESTGEAGSGTDIGSGIGCISEVDGTTGTCELSLSVTGDKSFSFPLAVAMSSTSFSEEAGVSTTTAASISACFAVPFPLFPPFFLGAIVCVGRLLPDASADLSALALF
jgi:hypothetical protein